MNKSAGLACITVGQKMCFITTVVICLFLVAVIFASISRGSRESSACTNSFLHFFFMWVGGWAPKAVYLGSIFN